MGGLAPLLSVAAFACALARGIRGRQGLQHRLSADGNGSQPVRAPPKYKVYTFWDYPKGPGPYVELNLKTWTRHLPPGTEVVFVNSTNFFDLVPDAPEYWLKMPDYGSMSDIVRSAVLYHQGGLYMDTDFLVMGPLDAVFSRLDEGWDVVAYSDEMGQARTGPCSPKKSFSSNFIAARKGNAFHRTWWENIKAKLGRLCAEYDYENNERICCQQAFDDEAGARKCKIPWGYLEHMKQPECDYDNPRRPPHCPPPLPNHPSRKPRGPDDPLRRTPEARGVLAAVELGRAQAARVPASARVLCLAGEDGMAPHINGEVYWQPWDLKAGATGSTESKDKAHYEFRMACREESGGDLTCDHGNWGKSQRNYTRFFNRTAYHLFFTFHVDKSVKTEREILEKDWLLSEMYRRALGM